MSFPVSDVMVNSDRPYASFANLLRERRQQRGLTLGSLARKSEVSKATLSYWESGMRAPSIPELENVLRALKATDVEVEALLAMFNQKRFSRRLIELNEELPPPTSGQFLRSLRRRSELSQQELAVQLGVRQSAVSRWELDISAPEQESRFQIADLLARTEEERDYLLRFRIEPPGSFAQELESLETHFFARFSQVKFRQVDYLCFRAATLAWPLRDKDPLARNLLASAFAHHAQHCARMERFEEAHELGDRALSFSEPGKVPYLRATTAKARAIALQRNRRDPRKAVNLLEQVSDYCEFDCEDAWVSGDISEYWAVCFDGSRAISTVLKALERVQRSRLRLSPVQPYAREQIVAQQASNAAAILLRFRQPVRALDLLLSKQEWTCEAHRLMAGEESQLDWPIVARQAGLLAHAQFMLGDKRSARDWVCKFDEVVEAGEVWHFRKRMRRLRRTLVG